MGEVRSERARETLELAHWVANLLNMGLDQPTLAVIMALTEQHINSEALATMVKELHCEATTLQFATSSSASTTQAS
ncbi:hypothetical protein L7F22_016042 [Adiantum nelumboides]|nr:hypothetical protein [Adiantum nelumboides]